MEEIKEIIMSHCKGIAYPEFDLEDLNVMVKEINDHYTKVQSQELTKAKEEVEVYKEALKSWQGQVGLALIQPEIDELLKEVK